MPLPDELLDISRRILEIDGPEPIQATLRRVVSTAYYALFHLLIGEAIENWIRPEFRPALGRVFEHGNMRSVSEKTYSDLNRKIKADPSTGNVDHLLLEVAKAFIDSQQQRISADYVISSVWTRQDAEEQISMVTDAFTAWHQIRNEPIAQAYLVAMLNKRATPA